MPIRSVNRAACLLAMLIAVCVSAPAEAQLQEFRAVDIQHGQSRADALGVGFGHLKGRTELLLDITANDPGVQIRNATPIEQSGQTIWTPRENPQDPEVFKFRNNGVQAADTPFAAVIRGELIVTGTGPVTGPPPLFHVAVADIDLDLANTADPTETASENSNPQGPSGALLTVGDERALTLNVQPRRSGRLTLSSDSPGVVKLFASVNGAAGDEITLPWEMAITGNTTQNFFVRVMTQGDTSLVARFQPDRVGSPTSGGPGKQPEDRVDISVDIQLESVRFLPSGNGASTTGVLSDDNPTGGHRFFPDARLTDQANSHRQGNNVVQVRAVLKGPPRAGVPIFFRSFDVDDLGPGADAAPIDPGGPGGGDNRGRLGSSQVIATTPTDPGADGWDGVLRASGTRTFDASKHRKVIRVLSKIALESGVPRGIAEVDLATTYAPGDNFRVGAALVEANLTRLNTANTRTDVPTLGAVPNFRGVFTQPLTVWRRIHMEVDVMARSSPALGDRARGELRGVERLNTPPERPIPMIRFGSGELNAPAPGLATLNTGIDIPANEDGGYIGGVLTLTDTDPPVLAGTQLATTFLVVSHGTGNNAQIVVGQVPQPGSPLLRTPEFRKFLTTTFKATLTPPPSPANTRRTSVRVQFPGNTPIGLHDFERGILRVQLANGFRNYTPIRANTENQGGFVTFLIDVPNNDLNQPPANPEIIVYQDDFVPPRGDANGEPTIRADTEDDASLRLFMGPTPDEAANRFARAFLQADFTSLASRNSRRVLSGNHAVGHMTANGLRDAAAAHRDTSGLEHQHFWVCHLMTGYEWARELDHDSPLEKAFLGFTIETGANADHSAVVFYEAAGDVGITMGLSPQAGIGRTAIHEIGHQFNVADVPPADGEHFDGAANIMHPEPLVWADSDFHFRVEDIAKLRKQFASPGAGR